VLGNDRLGRPLAAVARSRMPPTAPAAGDNAEAPSSHVDTEGPAPQLVSTPQMTVGAPATGVGAKPTAEAIRA